MDGRVSGQGLRLCSFLPHPHSTPSRDPRISLVRATIPRAVDAGSNHVRASVTFGSNFMKTCSTNTMQLGSLFHVQGCSQAFVGCSWGSVVPRAGLFSGCCAFWLGNLPHTQVAK